MSAMVTTMMYPESLMKDEWVELIKENRKLFCRLDNGFALFTSPLSPHPEQDKCKVIINALERFGKVIWVGADAVCLHEIHEEHLPNELSMAHDIGGLNDDVLITVKTDIPFWQNMQILLPYYQNNPMHSQAIMNDMKVSHKIIALDEWNARWVKEYAKIIHYAGMSQDKQFAAVKRACEGAKTRLLDGVNL